MLLRLIKLVPITLTVPNIIIDANAITRNLFLKLGIALFILPNF